MSAPNIRGAQPPPVSKEPEYDVIGLPAGRDMDVLLLGDMIWGIDCHWVETPGEKSPGYSVLCTKYCERCPHCGVHRPLWLAFLPVIDLNQKKRVVLRLGDKSYSAVAGYVGRLVSWHGTVVRARRVGAGRTAGALVGQSPLRAPDPLPLPHAMSKSIRRVLRCEHLPDFHLDREESMSVPLSDENGGA